MTNPLQTKDKQWRDRPNGATPVFDAGLSPLGTDAEAGGAPAIPPSDAPAAPSTPMNATPDTDGPGLRLTPKVWYGLAGLIVLALIIAGVASFS
ncbi:hypothetical protein [Brevundimonas sp. PAMC22021]|uniref:hypothetical protein n=1 Tax=Brevundimonas sp. PAMC22021 TaxID=2861285 RepID=UPI001C632EC1|nr:hypothetical protein [Brevundimonas sp. PAMC22021]QYF87083.1 hypothetical protein KY493_00725 [Brevundimonas sp. PAMC22021]